MANSIPELGSLKEVGRPCHVSISMRSKTPNPEAANHQTSQKQRAINDNVTRPGALASKLRLSFFSSSRVAIKNSAPDFNVSEDLEFARSLQLLHITSQLPQHNQRQVLNFPKDTSCVIICIFTNANHHFLCFDDSPLTVNLAETITGSSTAAPKASSDQRPQNTPSHQPHSSFDCRSDYI